MKNRLRVACMLLLLGTALVLGTSLADSPRPADRIVFLTSNLTPEQMIVLTANVAAGGNKSVVLVDDPRTRRYSKAFLDAYRPSAILPVGAFPRGVSALEDSLQRSLPDVVTWKRGQPEELWKRLVPHAQRVVVCPIQPRRLLLHAACLAGVLRAPLYAFDGKDGDESELERRLGAWGCTQVYAVGAASRSLARPGSMKVHALADEEAVASAYLTEQLKNGAIQTFVVANAADVGKGNTSSLAPWVALERRGFLVLTNSRGDDTTTVVREAMKLPGLARVEHLTLVANLQAIPMERRRNPLPGVEEFVELEPAPSEGNEPFTFATGRLFDHQPGVVALMLARARLLAESNGPRKALIVSNPGGGLPLLESISRNTAKELKNAGYNTSVMFNQDANQNTLRKWLPEQDLFLWEGHHSVLVASYGVPSWPDPLRPSLVFLQSCMALTENEAHPFLQRGAVAVIGSGSRTYSASGGAITLAYFDALLYEHRTLGGSLRQAKNFLLAYAQLKEKRLGAAAKLGGANIRSAWAFTLWGDPTIKLPAPPTPKEPLAIVQPRVQGNRILLTVPETPYDRVASDRYRAQMWPNSRLAGYISKQPEDDTKRLMAFFFAEVQLPKAPPGKSPRLKSRIPSDRYVFTWDARRQAGYLLVLPRTKDRGELRFQVEWVD
jgi:hypothetical protein